MGILPNSISAQHICGVHTEVSREHQIPWTWITDGCESPCGCWDLNPGPLEEQPVLLTAEPSLQPLMWPLPTPAVGYHIVVGTAVSDSNSYGLSHIFHLKSTELLCILPQKWLG